MTDKIANWYFKDLDQTTSTNDAVIDFLKQIKAPCILSAKIQTNGRGRLGRNWQSADGNLYVSFAYQIKHQNLGHMAILSALAVLTTLETLAQKNIFQIKWPNDVLAQNKKISGILFENAFDDYWVMGIGINIKTTPFLINAPYEATSLKDLGIIIDRLSVLTKLVQNFDTLKTLYEEQGFECIKKSWLDKAYNRDKRIIIKQLNNKQSGILKTLDDDGRLVIETPDGLKKIITGDVFNFE